MGALLPGVYAMVDCLGPRALQEVSAGRSPRGCLGGSQ